MLVIYFIIEEHRYGVSRHLLFSIVCRVLRFIPRREIDDDAFLVLTMLLFLVRALVVRDDGLIQRPSSGRMVFIPIHRIRRLRCRLQSSREERILLYTVSTFFFTSSSPPTSSFSFWDCVVDEGWLVFVRVIGAGHETYYQDESDVHKATEQRNSILLWE